MKHVIYLLTLAFGISSCNNKTAENPFNEGLTDSLHTNSLKKTKTNIYIKDKSQYDQSFIDGLSDYNEPIKLIDNYIVADKDTTYFPEDLPLNKETVFKATKDNKIFVLKVTRTNLTNLNYNFVLSDVDGKTLDNKSGKSILGSLFFFASEMDEDSQTHDGYGSSEYWDKSNKCWFAIRIGNGRDENEKHRAMLDYGCNDKSSLPLEECPTLHAD